MDLETAIIEEWKILQGKIDKIGEFRFHIKNWAATIVVAFIVGLFVTNASPWLVASSLLLPLAFFLIEQRQERILTVLMRRAARLESAMQRSFASHYNQEQMDQLIGLLGAAGFIPGTARDLRTFARSRHYRPFLHNEIIFYVIVSGLIVFAALGDGCRLRAVNAKEKRHHKELHDVKTTMRFIRRADKDLRNATKSLDGVADQLSRLSIGMSVMRLKPLPSKNARRDVARNADASIDLLTDFPVTLELTHEPSRQLTAQDE